MKKLIFLLLPILILLANGDEDSLTWEEDSIKSVMDTLDIENVYKNAAKWEVGNARPTVKMARKELIERGDEALDYMFFEKFGYPSGLEDRANKALIKGLLEDAEPRIYECLDDNPRGYLASSATYIGDFKLEAGYDSLIAMMSDTSEDRRKIKRVTIRALGAFGRKEAAMHLHSCLQDTIEYTRITTVSALGKLANEQSIEPMLDALNDSMFTIRQAINLSFKKFGKRGICAIKSRLCKAQPDLQLEYIRLLGTFTDDETKKKAFKILKKYAKDDEARIRAWALIGMSKIDKSKSSKVAKKLKDENDPLVLWAIDEASKN